MVYLLIERTNLVNFLRTQGFAVLSGNRPRGGIQHTAFFALQREGKECASNNTNAIREMNEELARFILQEVPSPIAEAVQYLSSFLVRESPLPNLRGNNEQRPNHAFVWKDSEVRAKCLGFLTHDLQERILISLFTILNARGALPARFHLAVRDLNNPSQPFYVPASRFAACMSAIDNFFINQILGAWQRTGEIPVASFAVTGRRIVAREEMSAFQPAQLKIQYRKSGGISYLTFNKDTQCLDTVECLPECVWQLNSFLESARSMRCADANSGGSRDAPRIA